MDYNWDELTPIKLPYSCVGYNIVNPLVLWPVDLCNDFKRSFKPLSLVHLCCDSLTKNSEVLRKVCEHIPATLYYTLLTTAEIKRYDQSIAVLMSTWPFKILSVFEIIIGGKGNLDFGQLDDRFTKYMERFVKVITDHATPRLRILDLRGMPLGDLLLNKLIREILFLSHDDSIPNDYHIIIDCNICESLDDLRRLLKINRERESKKKTMNIKLHISKLNIDNSVDDDDECFDLLEELNPNELIGLACPVDITDEAKFSIIKRFTSLVAFFPCGTLSSIQFLHQLRRLQLVSGNIPEIFDATISEKLEYLDLTAEGNLSLSNCDFQHLTSVQLRLRELNLSLQEFGEDNWRSWSGFLLSLASTLEILKMEWCVDDNNLFRNLVNCILSLVNLRYLNLANNELTNDILKLTELPKLECIGLSTYFKFFRDISPEGHPQDIKKQIEFKFGNKSPPILVTWL